MYIQLPQPKQKCSECGAIDQTELVTRSMGYGKGIKTFRRCMKCGHERLVSTTTYGSTGDDNKEYIYTMPKPDDVEEF